MYTINGVRLDQEFPAFLLPYTPSAFQQLSMYPFKISTDEHVPLKFLITKYFIMIIQQIYLTISI